MRATFSLITALLLFMVGPHLAYAVDGPIMPPTDFNNISCDSNQSQGGGLLYWDGAGPIHCVPGSAGNSAGDVQFKNSLSVTTAALPESACPTIGALSHDETGKPLFCQAIEGGKMAWKPLTSEYATGSLVGYCVVQGQADQSMPDPWGIVTNLLSPAIQVADPNGSNQSQCGCPPGFAQEMLAFTPGLNMMQNGWGINVPSSTSYTCYKNP